MTVKTKDMGWNRIRRNLDKLDKMGVSVGIHEEEATQSHSNGDATIGEVAAFVEFGTSKMPARPFMTPDKDVVIKAQQQALEAIAKGADVEAVLAQFGDVLTDDVLMDVPIDTATLYASIKNKIVRGES